MHRYYTTLKRDQVPVYKKADLSSEVIAKTPAGVTSLDVDYSVPGLGGGGIFWHVAHFETEPRVDIWGYISGDDVLNE
jgi:hypothetical protein